MPQLLNSLFWLIIVIIGAVLLNYATLWVWRRNRLFFWILIIGAALWFAIDFELITTESGATFIKAEHAFLLFVITGVLSTVIYDILESRGVFRVR